MKSRGIRTRPQATRGDCHPGGARLRASQAAWITQAVPPPGRPRDDRSGSPWPRCVAHPPSSHCRRYRPHRPRIRRVSPTSAPAVKNGPDIGTRTDRLRYPRRARTRPSSTMTVDPILSEIRCIREEYARRFRGDARAMMDDLRRRHAGSGRKSVTRQPKHRPRIQPLAHSRARFLIASRVTPNISAARPSEMRSPLSACRTNRDRRSSMKSCRVRPAGSLRATSDARPGLRNHLTNANVRTRRATLREVAGNHASSLPAPPRERADRARTPRRPASLALAPMGWQRVYGIGVPRVSSGKVLGSPAD